MDDPGATTAPPPTGCAPQDPTRTPIVNPLAEGRNLANADDIPVERFDLTLLWPVLLRECNDARTASIRGRRPVLDRWADAIQSTGVWRQGQSTDLTTETGYSEFVYFHPFVRDFLYPNRSDVRHAGAAAQNSSLRVFRRSDISAVVVEAFVAPDRPNDVYRLDARDVELFVFDHGVAILAVHLLRDATDGSAWSLAQVLRLQDVIRRLHAPYWAQYGANHVAGHCPVALTIERRPLGAPEVSWTANFGCYTSADDASHPGRQAVREQLRNVTENLEPLPVLPWRRLMEPLAPVTTEPPSPDCLQYEQIEDERMQVLSYLAVRDPRQVRAGDWVRLATIDDPGRSECYPYGPAFVRGGGLRADSFAAYVYDRFWDPIGEPPADPYMTSTRWLCSGYGFSGVGSSESPFFTDPVSGARAHFRFHYFKLALIAHMHRAALLGFQQRLTDLLDARRDGNATPESRERQFQADLARLQEDFLSFRNHLWFVEVSNQIQARELFELWAHHLNTRALFADVASEIGEATSLRQADRVEASIAQIAVMQNNIEWVELFIVGAYALEMAHVVPLIFKYADWRFTAVSLLLVGVSTAIVAAAIRPWKHEKLAYKKWLIAFLAVLFAAFVGVTAWLNPEASVKASTPKCCVVEQAGS